MYGVRVRYAMTPSSAATSLTKAASASAGVGYSAARYGGGGVVVAAGEAATPCARALSGAAFEQPARTRPVGTTRAALTSTFPFRNNTDGDYGRSARNRGVVARALTPRGRAVSGRLDHPDRLAGDPGGDVLDGLAVEDLVGAAGDVAEV